MFDCRIGKKIDTAYYLARACRERESPVDAQTRGDYGFDKALRTLGSTGEDTLLGLWREIIVHAAVPAQEVRKWRKEGRIVQVSH